MKGYKGFNKDMTCRDFQYEIGKEYETNEEIELCKRGFHFCKKIIDVKGYYNIENDEVILCEIEATGEIIEGDDKCVTNRIKIIREISKEEMYILGNEGEENTGLGNTGNRNTGDWNTGYSNTGYSNTGDSNTGNRNTGDWNTGDSNTGDSNTGNSNTGDSNTGDSNTGNRNTGNRNTGDSNTGYSNTGNRNTGDWNTGYSNTGYSNTGNRNTGDSNTGYSNTGNRNTGYSNTGDSNTGNRNTGNSNTGYSNTGNSNTGDSNTGDSNTGNRNTGNRNTGDWNTGYSNTGNWNTGNRNTGDWNKTNRSAGVFCNEEPKMNMFNKETDMTYEEWRNSEAYDILTRVTKSQWIWYDEMTEAEKKKYPSAKTCDGYLKETERKTSSKEWWKSLEIYEKATIIQLPNFDLDIFNDIMEFKVTKKEYKEILKWLKSNKETC